jgi:hypothetical protein
LRKYRIGHRLCLFWSTYRDTRPDGGTAIITLTGAARRLALSSPVEVRGAVIALNLRPTRAGQAWVLTDDQFDRLAAAVKKGQEAWDHRDVPLLN